MLIGRNFKEYLHSLHADGKDISWDGKVKYLDVCFTTSKVLSWYLGNVVQVLCCW